MAAQAKDQGDDPCRLRRSVCQHGVAVVLGKHNLDASLSRRGTCHDNAVAERVFHLFKRERSRRLIDPTLGAARQDGFDYIEIF